MLPHLMCDIQKNIFKWTGKMESLALAEDRLFPPFFSPLYISLIIDLTNTLKVFNYYKYTFMITNMLIIIIGLLVYYCYYFLLYRRFHLSPVEHQNLRSKVGLMGNSTKFLKIPFLKMCKNKISNKCCFHLPKSIFVGNRCCFHLCW